MFRVFPQDTYAHTHSYNNTATLHSRQENEVKKNKRSPGTRNAYRTYLNVRGRMQHRLWMRYMIVL